MATVAVFPLSLVREAVRARRHTYWRHGEPQRVAVRFRWLTPDHANSVTCGDRPLVAHACIEWFKGFPQARGCYINNQGQQVWPA